MPEKQNSSTIGRGAAWSFLDNTARQFLALLVFLVTARYVSIEAFGIMAVALLIVEAFKQTLIDSVGTAITAKSKPDDEDYNASFIIIIITSVVSALFIYIFAGTLASILGNEKIADVLRMICIVLATIGLSRTHEAWLSRHMRFKALALRSMASIILGGGVGIYMAVEGYGLSALIYQQLVIALVSTILLWISTPWKPKLKTTRAKLLDLIHYSRHVVVINATVMVKTQSDVFIASYFLGEIATGIYNASKRIMTALNLILITSINRVALPALSNIQDDAIKTSHAYLKSVLITSMLIAPIYAGISFLADDLISVLLGEKWSAAAPILSILAISGFIGTLDQFNNIAILVKQKPQLQARLSLLYAVTSIILLVIFARYGLIYLALAYTARSLLFYPISLGFALTLLKIPFKNYLKTVYPTLIATGIMYGGLVFLTPYIHFNNSILNILMSSVIGAVIYFVVYACINYNAIKQVLAEAKIIIKN